MRPPAGGRVLCSKGIEERSGKLLHEVASEVVLVADRRPFGPTFAHQVAVGLPTAVTLACTDRALGEQLRSRIDLVQFRTYCTDDVAGAEREAQSKTCSRSPAGSSRASGFGQNARAALIARGCRRNDPLRGGEWVVAA